MPNNIITLNERIKQVKHFFDTTGFENACIGISGGKDSAVVAALLTRALGPEHVIATIVPCGIMPDMNDAKQICKSLNLTPHIIPIGIETSNMQNSILRETNQQINKTIIEAHINATSRIRTCALRYMAAINNALLVGTTNKSEWFVGYFTKGGDDAVDFEPILDLNCTEVIELGKQLPEIPSHILNKKPNDGLSGRTDEDRLGITYAQIDTYLQNGTTNDPAIDAKIQQLHQNSRHKRQGVPTL